MTRVVLEIHEGRVAGALLGNGLLDRLGDAGAEVLVVGPGARVPAFVERHGAPHVRFVHLPVQEGLSRAEGLHRRLDRRLAGPPGRGRRRFGALRRSLWRGAEALALGQAARELDLLRSWRPDVVVACHVLHGYGRCLVAAAHRLGIPTVGNLFSWDNAYRGLASRPRRMTCWSETNRRELDELWGFPPERTDVIGAPFFDAYLAPEAEWPREELCRRMGLDPGRPILLFATLGQFRAELDETDPFAALLRSIDRGCIPGRPQVVLRLHPTSRLAYFAALARRPDVAVSRYEGYHPGLGWAPDREEMTLAANLFRHADVVVSPGSTVTLEAAIFDTPIVVPVFHELMPQEYERFFASTWLEGHLRPLVEDGLLRITRSADETAREVCHALEDPARGRAERAAIRARYLEPLDGRATERFARVILKTGEARG
ncbi:MAG TPA: hypothetical protein VLF66_10305 [Thermoanaerobaculia bacterium]|nr:hypothetical protein [Thermoanaerobaculia bacterium]